MRLGFKHEPTGGLVSMQIGKGKVISISTMSGGVTKYGTLEDIKYNRVGILKKFPDLKDLAWAEMRKKAIERLRKHILAFDSEEKVKDYLINDFKEYGYELYLTQKKGFRPKRCRQ